MRTASSALGVIAAGLLLGACFDPTRQCSTNADCVNGGTCDPGTKTCVAAGNPNDKIPPVFTITVTAAPARPDSAKLTGYDPGSPGGGHDAFRRDEDVHVVVTSPDRDVDAGSVTLSARGISQSLDVTLIAAINACEASNPAASSPFCQEGTIHLAQLPFDTFRGSVRLEARGADLSNNLGSADAGINVTRWKWRYAAGAPIYTTPAIADDGTVVFGTSDGGSGSVYALRPDGSEKWAPAALGQIRASPVVGTSDGGQQFAYVGTSGTLGGNLLALDIQDGSTVTSCPNGGGTYAGAVIGTPGLVVSGSSSFEGALGIANGSKLVNIRPGASLADDRCISIDTVGTQGFPANVVAAGAQSFAAGSDGTVRSFARQSGIWLDNAAWGGGTGATVVSNRPIQALALTSRLFGTTRLRGVFELQRDTGGFSSGYPDGGLVTDPGGPVLIGSQLWFADGASAQPSVLIVEDSLAQGSRISVDEPTVSTPVSGAGGKVYLATVLGSLVARTLTELSWSGSLGSGEGFLASPTIDCGVRDGGHPIASTVGILYLGSTSGSLFAVIVDSPGLDSSAPWPKYQHDIRNTGNPTTPIQSCP